MPFQSFCVAWAYGTAPRRRIEPRIAGNLPSLPPFEKGGYRGDWACSQEAHTEWLMGQPQTQTVQVHLRSPFPIRRTANGFLGSSFMNRSGQGHQ